MKKVAPSLKYIDFSYAKDLWNLGAKFFIIQIQQIVLYQATNILISHLSGPSSVAQYNIAYKILNVVIMVYQIILTPLWPAFTDAYAKQDYEWMNRTYRKMVQVYILLAAGLCTLTILSQPIYQLWVGNNIEIPFVLTTSIAIYTLVHSWDSLQVTLINGIGKVKLQTRVILVGLILHIPLSLLIGKYIQIYGVIISMCIINVIYAIVFTTQLRKILNHTAKGIWTE